MQVVGGAYILYRLFVAELAWLRDWTVKIVNQATSRHPRAGSNSKKSRAIIGEASQDSDGAEMMLDVARRSLGKIQHGDCGCLVHECVACSLASL